jgi:hypothetical protein
MVARNPSQHAGPLRAASDEAPGRQPDPRTQLTTRYDLLLAITAGSLAFLLALYRLSGTLANGVYYPADHDSFYHAHRILAALDSPTHLLQFDPAIHAPEGSWITWPWAYDMAMAAIAHVAVVLFHVDQPLAVLAYVAPLWAFVNAALVLGIARQLGFSLVTKIVVLACFAFSPLTQSLHRVGMLDHHFIEYSFVLATLWSGLWWFQQIGTPRAAMVLGAILGAAPAFHCGLFILQLPVLAALGIHWLRGRALPERAAAAFALSLIVSTFLFLLPSEPFRRMMFFFGLHSWFHLFIAMATSLLACELAKLRRSAGSAALLAGTALALLAVVATQLPRGGHFVSGKLAGLEDMEEVRGIQYYLSAGQPGFLSDTYSGLIWLLPLAIVGLCWRAWRQRQDRDTFLVPMTLFGVALLCFQYRFENYGSFALYFPLCSLAESARQLWPAWSSRLSAAVAGIALVAYVPALPSLAEAGVLGGGNDYALTRKIYPTLAQSCEKQPGVVLADNQDGHYITFHTRCSVIADTFILTAQHEQKFLLVDQLLHLPLREVLERAPYVRYIYVRRNDNFFASDCARRACPENAGLRQELLFAPTIPDGLRLLGELRVTGPGGDSEVLARAFAVSAPGL